jgi:hypothetical protein
MDRCDGFVGASSHVAFKQLRKPRLVEIARRAIAVQLDPVVVLRTKIVMNLEPKCGKCVDRLRSGNLRGHRFRSAQHERLDKSCVEVVQIDVLEFV